MSILGLTLVISAPQTQENNVSAINSHDTTMVNSTHAPGDVEQLIKKMITEKDNTSHACDCNNHVIKQKWVSVNDEPFRATSETVHLTFYHEDDIDKLRR